MAGPVGDFAYKFLRSGGLAPKSALKQNSPPYNHLDEIIKAEPVWVLSARGGVEGRHPPIFQAPPPSAGAQPLG